MATNTIYFAAQKILNACLYILSLHIVILIYFENHVIGKIICINLKLLHML